MKETTRRPIQQSVRQIARGLNASFKTRNLAIAVQWQTARIAPKKGDCRAGMIINRFKLCIIRLLENAYLTSINISLRRHMGNVKGPL